VGQRAGPEGGHLGVQLPADPADSDLEIPASTPNALTRSSTLRVEVPCTWCGCRNPSTSCELGIFVDQPADAIQPHDRYVGRWSRW
jgi:hypothetical protein